MAIFIARINDALREGFMFSDAMRRSATPLVRLGI